MSTHFPVPRIQPQAPSLPATPNGEASEADPKRKNKKGKKDRKEEKAGFSRGVETLFRSAYQTHVNLTGMADGKASIMLTVNGLLLSVVLATITPRISSDEWLIVPVVIVLLTCLASLLFAVLAVRPRLIRRAISLDVVRRDGANLLFFGNYAQLTEADFRLALGELIRDQERLYDVMTRDLYGMGTVLGRKYHLLQRSYDVFATGMIIGVVAFVMVYVKMAW
jgi:hypothetical protein